VQLPKLIVRRLICDPQGQSVELPSFGLRRGALTPSSQVVQVIPEALGDGRFSIIRCSAPVSTSSLRKIADGVRIL
jgi:hypothetical protein